MVKLEAVANSHTHTHQLQWCQAALSYNEEAHHTMHQHRLRNIAFVLTDSNVKKHSDAQIGLVARAASDASATEV